MLRELLDAHGDELAADSGLPRRLLDELGAIPSYYLHYFYAHDRVLAEQRDGAPRAAEVAEIERELLELYGDPALDDKPALLEQRGGAFYSEAATALVALAARPATARRTWSTSATTARCRASGRRRRRGAGAGGRDGRASRSPQAPLAPELLGLVAARRRVRAAGARAAVTGDRGVARKALLAHPLVGQDEIAAADLLDGDARARAAAMSRTCSPSTAATPRPTWRCCATTARCWRTSRGGLSSPHHIGLDGCVELLRSAARRGAARGRDRRPAGRRRRAC